MHLNITKTRLYNFDPLKPHFNIVKLGFTAVYIIFLIFANKHRLWVLTSIHSLCFEQKYKKKCQKFYLKTFQFFWVVKFSIYLNRLVFVMNRAKTLCWKFWLPFSKRDFFNVHVYVSLVYENLSKSDCFLKDITKTYLFKYTEHFITKKWNFSDKKFWYFFIFLFKTKIVGTR